MRFEGAVIKEQGVSFAVVVVKPHVVNVPSEARKTIAGFMPVFPGMPVVLMAQDARGTPTYFGRPDIAKFLANVPVASIPWREYTVN